MTANTFETTRPERPPRSASIRIDEPLGWMADADTHFYETRDAFTRFIEPGAEHLAVRVVDAEGEDQIWVGDRRFTFLSPLYEQAPLPGSLRDVLRNLQSGQITEERLQGPVEPAFVERSARIAWMDEHRVETAVIVPSLAGTIEHYMKHDAEQTRVNVRAFNRWLEEEWGFADERLISTPMVSLIDVDHAIAEIEWLRDRGAKCVHLRPGPQGGRSPADPVFDPFWARLVEAEIVVVLHISESSYNEAISTSWSEPAHPSAWEISAFQWTTTYGDRPIIDTLAAMVLHNLFGRFPGLRVMSLENGSIWVPYLLASMDKMKGMGRNSPWLGGRVEGRPSEVFREHVWVSPYHEEDVEPLIDAIGIERVLFGSDFPHPEGIARPEEYREVLDGLDVSSQQRIMGGNLLALLGR